MHQPNGPVRAADRPCALRRAVAIAAFLLAASPLAAFAQSADLVINQADLPPVGPAGGVFTYTVRVDNNGPDGATGVTLSNTIPPGSTYVGVTPTQGSCSQAAGVVSCTLGNLAFLAQATVTIQVILPTPGVWTNSASTTSAVSDPNLTNNASIEDTTAQNASNMAATATDGPDPVAAGAAYSYTVTATNNGPTNLGATDTQTIWFVVPVGSCITSAPTGSGWSCTVSPSASYPVCSNGSSASIDCVRTGALATGASAPVLTIPAVANIGGSITAAFHVESSLPDGDESDNTVEATTTVIGGYSDVSITKTRSPTTVTVGTNVTYTLTPRHLGGEQPGTLAPNLITVTDTLDAGLTFVSVAGTGWTCDTTGLPTIVCTRPGPWTGGNFTDMPAITIVATVNTAGTIPNTATIGIPEQDPNPSNNTSSVNVTGTNNADLRMTKTASINPVIPGQAFSYALTVRNLGNAAVQAGQTITATDTLPAGVELTAAPTGTGWTCTPDGTATYPIAGPVAISCTRSGPLASSTNAPVITVPARLPAAGSALNTACVALTGSGPTDSASGNDCAGVTVVASVAQADLQVVSKTASPNPVNAGEDLTYTISVINNGPDPATNVVVTDSLASLIAVGGFRSATPSQGTCTPSGVTNGATVNLSCNLGTLADDATATVTVVVRPSRATTGSRTNTATITSNDVGDPNRTNNSASVTSTVTAIVDIQALKTATPSPVQAGAPLLFVVTARNNGPSTASNVVATDTLPANAAFISLGPVTGGGSCTTPAVNAVGGQVVCTWPTLAATSPPTQQTASYYVRPLTSAAGGNVVNSVCDDDDRDRARPHEQHREHDHAGHAAARRPADRQGRQRRPGRARAVDDLHGHRHQRRAVVRDQRRDDRHVPERLAHGDVQLPGVAHRQPARRRHLRRARDQRDVGHAHLHVPGPREPGAGDRHLRDARRVDRVGGVGNDVQRRERHGRRARGAPHQQRDDPRDDVAPFRRPRGHQGRPRERDAGQHDHVDDHRAEQRAQPERRRHAVRHAAGRRLVPERIGGLRARGRRRQLHARHARSNRVDAGADRRAGVDAVHGRRAARQRGDGHDGQRGRPGAGEQHRDVDDADQHVRRPTCRSSRPVPRPACPAHGSSGSS